MKNLIKKGYNINKNHKARKWSTIRFSDIDNEKEESDNIHYGR